MYVGALRKFHSVIQTVRTFNRHKAIRFKVCLTARTTSLAHAPFLSFSLLHFYFLFSVAILNRARVCAREGGLINESEC